MISVPLSGSATSTGDLDAVRGRAALDPFVSAQRAEQAALAHLALADQDQLGLVQDYLRFRVRAQVAHDGVEALFVGGGEFGFRGLLPGRVPPDAQAAPAMLVSR